MESDCAPRRQLTLSETGHSPENPPRFFKTDSLKTALTLAFSQWEDRHSFEWPALPYIRMTWVWYRLIDDDDQKLLALIACEQWKATHMKQYIKQKGDCQTAVIWFSEEWLIYCVALYMRSAICHCPASRRVQIVFLLGAYLLTYSFVLCWPAVFNQKTTMQTEQKKLYER